MKEINLITRNSKYYVISELHKLSKLIWQKKKMLWLQTVKIFFLQCGKMSDLSKYTTKKAIVKNESRKNHV